MCWTIHQMKPRVDSRNDAFWNAARQTLLERGDIPITRRQVRFTLRSSLAVKHPAGASTATSIYDGRVTPVSASVCIA